MALEREDNPEFLGTLGVKRVLIRAGSGGRLIYHDQSGIELADQELTQINFILSGMALNELKKKLHIRKRRGKRNHTRIMGDYSKAG